MQPFMQVPAGAVWSKTMKLSPKKLFLVTASLLVLILPACRPVSLEAQTPTLTVESRTGTPGSGAVTSTPKPTPLPTSTINVNEEDLQGVQITLWHALTGAAEIELQMLADEFNTSNEWGIQLQVETFQSYSELVKQTNNVLGTEDLPELVLATPEQLAAWYEEGAGLVNLDTYIYDPDWGMQPDQINDIFPVFWNQNVFQDQRLGFPAIQTAEVLVYNRTWAHALNYKDPPLTPDAFFEQACAASKANADEGYYGKGGWFMNTEPAVALAWLAAFGTANPLTEDGYSFNTPDTRQAFRYLRALAESSCAWNNEIPTPEESTEPFVYFANRQALLASLSVDELPVLAAAMAYAKNSDDWVVLPYPTEDASGKVVSFGFSYGMLAPGQREQLAAWLAIQWLSEPGQSAWIAEAAGSLPISESAVQNMKLTPQLEQAIALIGLSVTPPVDASWVKVQPILRDAMWENTVDYQRIYAIENAPVRAVEEILEELETLAQEFNK